MEFKINKEESIEILTNAIDLLSQANQGLLQLEVGDLQINNLHTQLMSGQQALRLLSADPDLIDWYNNVWYDVYQDDLMDIPEHISVLNILISNLK